MSPSTSDLEARRILEECSVGNGRRAKAPAGLGFQMPLHYPRYSKSDYETMPEWELDRLLAQYGLPVSGDVDAKRSFAMGAFLWPADCPKTEQSMSNFHVVASYIPRLFI